EALKLFKDIGDRLGEANVLQSHGKLLIFSQKPEEGLKMLQDALNIYEEIDSIPSQANIYFFLGQILASNGQKDKSIELLQQAVELGNKIDPNHPVSIYMKAFLDKVKK
ncbi:MAG TPA: tetratricopeptide repeat protein, partial [Anaerolineales bacterium]|nr:tetratricopeptide repeat protein [Anaerolineales bacterium]